jgi:hypothetical protein
VQFVSNPNILDTRCLRKGRCFDEIWPRLTVGWLRHRPAVIALGRHFAPSLPKTVSASGTTVFRNLRRDQDWNKWDDPDGVRHSGQKTVSARLADLR